MSIDNQPTDPIAVKGRIALKEGNLVFMFQGTTPEEVPVQPNDKLRIFGKNGTLFSEGLLVFQDNLTSYMPEDGGPACATEEGIFKAFGQYGMELVVASEHEAIGKYILQHTTHNKVLDALSSRDLTGAQKIIANRKKQLACS
jgi:hypothetical protein